MSANIWRPLEVVGRGHARAALDDRRRGQLGINMRVGAASGGASAAVGSDYAGTDGDTADETGGGRHGGRTRATQRDGIVHPGWMPFYEATRIPAAVRAGQTLYLTGHAGDAADGTSPSDVESQVRNAFANLGATLHAAGAEWSDVVQVTSYHIGVREQVPIMLEVAAEYFEEPYPAWMAVGVAELFDEGGVIDIACTVVIRGPAC